MNFQPRRESPQMCRHPSLDVSQVSHRVCRVVMRSRSSRSSGPQWTTPALELLREERAVASGLGLRERFRREIHGAGRVNAVGPGASQRDRQLRALLTCCQGVGSLLNVADVSAGLFTDDIEVIAEPLEAVLALARA